MTRDAMEVGERESSFLSRSSYQDCCQNWVILNISAVPLSFHRWEWKKLLRNEKRSTGKQMINVQLAGSSSFPFILLIVVVVVVSIYIEQMWKNLILAKAINLWPLLTVSTILSFNILLLLFLAFKCIVRCISDIKLVLICLRMSAKKLILSNCTAELIHCSTSCSNCGITHEMTNNESKLIVSSLRMKFISSAAIYSLPLMFE